MLLRTLKFLTVVGAASASLNLYAEVRVLDFDTDGNGDPIVAGQVIDTEYQDLGVVISSCNYFGTGPRDSFTDTSLIDSCNNGGVESEQTQITYDTVGDTEIDTDLEFEEINGEYVSKESGDVYNTDGLPDAFSDRTNPGNILILSEYENNITNTVDGEGDIFLPDSINDQGSRASGFFTFDFDFDVNLNSIDFFDVEDQPGQDPAFFAIQFFDELGTELTSLVDEIPTLEDGGFTRLQFNAIGVRSIRINLPGSGGIDNLVFTVTSPVDTSEVSAPSGAIMLAMFGIYVWRRRSVK